MLNLWTVRDVLNRASAPDGYTFIQAAGPVERSGSSKSYVGIFVEDIPDNVLRYDDPYPVMAYRATVCEVLLLNGALVDTRIYELWWPWISWSIGDIICFNSLPHEAAVAIAEKYLETGHERANAKVVGRNSVQHQI